jgi:hypothetical protein
MNKIINRLKPAIAAVMFLLVANANAVPSFADFNNNGIVDSNDAAVLFAQFGMTSANSAFNSAVDMNGTGAAESRCVNLNPLLYPATAFAGL